MARHRTIQVGALNISANPHPEGIYLSLLKDGSTTRVNYRGNDWAKISRPKKLSDLDGVYTGRLLAWTEIDTKGPWLDTESEDVLSADEKAKIVIPSKAKPNYRVFSYAFKERGHRLYIELRNELGDSLGPHMAQKIFYNLLSPSAFNREIDLDVTVVPTSGAVNRVLGLPGLRKLHIRVIAPNADTTDEAKRKRVLDRLDEANAKQLDETYIKKAGEERLIATPEIRETAEIAAENGFVTGTGRVEGKTIEASTTKLPRRENIPADQPGASFISRLMGAVGLF